MNALERLAFVDAARLAELARAGETVVVAFVATWNARCQAFGADYLAFAAQPGEAVRAVAVDVDECSALTAEYGVCSVPTLVVLRAGREAHRSVGTDLAALRAYLGKAG